MISIAMTFKGREKFLNLKLLQLTHMNFNHKEIEVCITVPEYTPELKEIIEIYYKNFYQIKLAISDRSVLPFQITTNQPTCDMNSQICNQVTFEKVIRTDPEVLFTDPNQLQYINDILDDSEICIWHDTINLAPDTPIHMFNNTYKNYYMHGCESNTCCCFNKSEFIKYRGFDERFALGVAAEDSYFIHGFTKRGKSLKSKYNVVHIYHGPPWNGNIELMQIYSKYTLPLFTSMEERNEESNLNNPNWKRSEMLSDEIIFKI